MLKFNFNIKMPVNCLVNIREQLHADGGPGGLCEILLICVRRPFRTAWIFFYILWNMSNSKLSGNGSRRLALSTFCRGPSALPNPSTFLLYLLSEHMYPDLITLRRGQS